MSKKIGIIFGMETTFPPALVDKINSMKSTPSPPNSCTIGGIRMAEPSPYHVIVDRISHDIPFYRGYLKNAALPRRDRHQQPLLVERRRQVLQLRAGAQTGRRHSAHRAAAAQAASAGHHRPLHAQPALPHAVGQHLQLRRLPGLPQALRRRRLEGRVQGQLAGRVLQGLRPDPRPVHDAAARSEVQGIFPLLRGRTGESAHHALRSRAPSTSAT